MGYVELVFRREGRFMRWYARKRLHEQHRSDPTLRSMFLDEARLAGLIHHPNAVGVQDVGADDEGPFFIMEFVEGVSLSRMIGDATAAGRAIPMQVAVRTCLDAARGLHAAHEVRAEDGTALRLIHRDVSPQNILISFDGTVRVTDFGIAKALGNSTRTSAGVLKGNMGYLAPEQLRFEEPDRRSDLFSLGVTLYEMLSGRRLYPNTAGFDGTRRILAEPAPDIGEVRSDVPAELCELLFELLAKDRDSRPSTAVEVASRLEGILALLISEEGSVTVGDYMDQHFGAARLEQRTTLAAHLAEIESRSTRAQSLAPSSSSSSSSSPWSLAAAREPAAAASADGRARTWSPSGWSPPLRRLVFAATLTTAAAAAVLLWPALRRRDAERAVPLASTSSLAADPKAGDPATNPAPPPPAGGSILVAETQAEPILPNPKTTIVAKTRHRSANRGFQRAHPAEPKKKLAGVSGGVSGKDRRDSTALAVPLFERWQ